MTDEVGRYPVRSWALMLIAVAAILAALQYSKSVDKTYPTRTFSVEGEGEIDITPDVAKFSVSVVTEGGKNVADVQKKNAEKMNAVDVFLKDSGITGKDLKTEEYTLSPRYDYPNCVGLALCPPPTITGYSLTQTLQVTVRDMEKLGDLLTGVVANGANSVSQASFTVDDEAEAKAEARKEAIEQAKDKAKRLAKDTGFEIGRLVSVYETPIGLEYSGDEEISAKSATGMGGALAPTIEPGTDTTKVTVSLTYEIR